MKAKSIRLRTRLRHVLWGTVLAVATVGALAASGVQANAQSGNTLVIRVDRGGMLGKRSEEIRYLRSTGRRVELRGTCLSACTMYLSLPDICVSPTATFGFHGPTRNGRALPSQEFDYWSNVMANNYREPLRSWYLSEARFTTSGYIRVRGAELISMGYPSC